jgi:hydroxypyruvate isomerase
MPRFAANLNWLFTERPFLERFAAARAAGFDAVEFPSPYAHPPETVATALRDAGLRCVLFNLPSGDPSKGDFGIACRPGRETEFREGVHRAMEYAQALGCGRINVVTGRILEGEDPAKLRAVLLGNVEYAAGQLHRAGIDFVIEPINDIDIPGFFVTRQDEGARIVEEIGRERLGLQCDLYHTAMKGDDPEATLRRLEPIIRHVQFADVPGRGEPGAGKLDWPHLFAVLDELPYKGWVSAEYKPTRRTEDTLDWLR